MVAKIPLFNRLLLELQSNCNRDCFFCNRTFDQTGKRLDQNGNRILKSMPTEFVLKIMDQAAEIGFKGKIAFHHMSEPFLDKRIIDMAWEARKRGFLPYEHTNGDVLKNDLQLCKEAAKVFDYIVIGLYDHKTDAERIEQEDFWKVRLSGTKVKFSLVDQVFPRSRTPFDERMFREKTDYPVSPCIRPLNRLIIHYDGNMALCCEDMSDMFDLGNAFTQSIHDLWYSSKHIAIIEELRKGNRHLYEACKNCPLPALEHASWHESSSWTNKMLNKLKSQFN